jgi:curved DNA-binding protein CbpA
MADYYSILGLTKTATDIEIKTAFRKLAKIYHPDKNPNNPNAKNLFENILKAYNTLINPHSRKRYDNSNFGTTTQTVRAQRSNQKKQKDYSVTEEDLKRRQYYKNYYDSKKHTVNASPKKTNYSDYKYILFATPIAVGLLMLIISLFNSEPKTKMVSKKLETPITETKKPSRQLANGDKPYSSNFGNIKTFDTKHILKINNSSNFDAVIVVFDEKTKTYLQHSYLRPSYSIEFSMLPDSGVYWKCMLGKNWNKDKLLFNNKIPGGFDSIVQYQNWEKLPKLFTNNDGEEINLLYVINPQSKNKQYISNDIEFFEK